jgi:hypothetical protein
MDWAFPYSPREKMQSRHAGWCRLSSTAAMIADDAESVSWKCVRAFQGLREWDHRC